jgi:hypothetical protein
MKNFIIAAASVLLFNSAAATTASAGSPSFSRSESTLINFQLGKVCSGAKVIIRNSAGQVVRSKSFFTSYCNIESSNLGSGSYTYMIVNGKQVAEGAFSVR